MNNNPCVSIVSNGVLMGQCWTLENPLPLTGCLNITLANSSGCPSLCGSSSGVCRTSTTSQLPSFCFSRVDTISSSRLTIIDYSKKPLAACGVLPSSLLYCNSLSCAMRLEAINSYDAASLISSNTSIVPTPNTQSDSQDQSSTPLFFYIIIPIILFIFLIPCIFMKLRKCGIKREPQTTSITPLEIVYTEDQRFVHVDINNETGRPDSVVHSRTASVYVDAPPKYNAALRDTF